MVAAGAEDGEFPARRADRARAAFVALAGSREAPFLEKKSARKGQPRVVRAKTPLSRGGVRGFRGWPRQKKYMKPMWSHRAVAVLAGMTAPKGSAEACTTRRRAPGKVYTVL